MVVGNAFKPQYYGLAISENRDMVERINRIHLSFMEDGFHNEIYEKYFGDN